MPFSNLEIKDIKGIPRYVQIREAIRTAIMNKELEIGTKLPPEPELANRFGVSRMTLRNAIDELVKEGMLMRKQGIGTIVLYAKVSRDYTHLTSFHEDVDKMGMKTNSKLISFEEIESDEKIAELLAIKPGSPVFCMKRVRYMSGTKVATYHEAYAAKSLCPWLEEIDIEDESLYKLYENHGLKIDWGRQRVEARSANEEISRITNIPLGAPVLHIQRVIYTKNNQPIEFVIAVNSGELFSLDMVLQR